MVERESAERLLSVLLDSIADLRRYRQTFGREQLKADRDTRHLVLHAFYLAAQAAVDLALHWAADAGLRRAENYQDAFMVLVEGRMIEQPLAGRLAAWAGFRNILAHFYAIVDYDRVYDALSEIDDLQTFAALVARRIESPPSG